MLVQWCSCDMALEVAAFNGHAAKGDGDDVPSAHGRNPFDAARAVAEVKDAHLGRFGRLQWRPHAHVVAMGAAAHPIAEGILGNDHKRRGLPLECSTQPAALSDAARRMHARGYESAEVQLNVLRAQESAACRFLNP